MPCFHHINMSSDERLRWDERYASGDYQPSHEQSRIVEEAVRYLDSGRCLVVACGTGRNALYLASKGFEVEAVDVSAVAIERARAEAERRRLDVTWRVADVDGLDLGVGRYDLITMIRYTNRDIWPRLVPALSDDGWVVLEQHLKSPRRVAGPANEFRVSPGEMLGAFPGLRVINYLEEFRRSENTGKMIATAALLACKGDPGW